MDKVIDLSVSVGLLAFAYTQIEVMLLVGALTLPGLLATAMAVPCILYVGARVYNKVVSWNNSRETTTIDTKRKQTAA